MYKTGLFFFLLFTGSALTAQDTGSDSSQTLDEVMVRAFEQNRQSRYSTAAISLLHPALTARHTKLSLVHGFNTVPGVRMEERSPGSYRLNIRGSSLRSPFGVRNIKVYWNDIPVTDPSGNTYFNQFALNNFSSIEVYKGPAGSMYGAGTGGLILLNNFTRREPGIQIEYLRGSYNTGALFSTIQYGNKQNRQQLSFAHQQSDGYRVQSAMRRDNFSWQAALTGSDKQQLTASFLYTDLYYQTPGALTAAEYATAPEAARPAGGGFPSAVAAKAAIYQQTLTAGFTNRYQFSTRLKNATTLYGSFARIRNSAIRNYERRNEPGYGGRTVFIYSRDNNGKAHSKSVQLLGGAEFQQGLFNIQVAKNRNGQPDTLQTNDDIRYTTISYFTQADWLLNKQWFLTAGISLNRSQVNITRLHRYPVITQKRSYRNELAPRIALKKFLTEFLSMKATLSRGFSPPTVAELLPSTGVISTGLEAEYGWNYELTANYACLGNRLQTEITGYYFRLKEALVQRRDLSGADYFVNAGELRQPGLEAGVSYTQSFSNKAIDHFMIRGGYTYSHYRYGSFSKGTDDFTGNTAPSVPAHSLSLLADLVTRAGFYLNGTWYSAGRIYLNDANTAFAAPYHLLGARAGWKKTLKKKYPLHVYAGADNLLDETYSLGNDINAAAGRFFNAAPRRNYYAGVALQWISEKKK